MNVNDEKPLINNKGPVIGKHSSQTLKKGDARIGN